MPYPTPSEVEQSLKRVAEEIGDTSESPFRVDMVARYGGKPPLYTVVIRCAEKEPIRQKLSQVACATQGLMLLRKDLVVLRFAVLIDMPISARVSKCCLSMPLLETLIPRNHE